MRKSSQVKRAALTIVVLVTCSGIYYLYRARKTVQNTSSFFDKKPVYLNILQLRLDLLVKLKMRAIKEGSVNLVNVEKTYEQKPGLYLAEALQTSQIHFINKNGKGFWFKEQKARYVYVMEKHEGEMKIGLKICVEPEKRDVEFDADCDISKENQQEIDALFLHENELLGIKIEDVKKMITSRPRALASDAGAFFYLIIDIIGTYAGICSFS